jgi:hypothetical protein
MNFQLFPGDEIGPIFDAACCAFGINPARDRLTPGPRIAADWVSPPGFRCLILFWRTNGLRRLRLSLSANRGGAMLRRGGWLQTLASTLFFMVMTMRAWSEAVENRSRTKKPQMSLFGESYLTGTASHALAGSL